MKKVLCVLSVVFLVVSCGPSAEEQKVHEEKREQSNQELEEDWENELDDLLEDTEEE